MDIHSQIKSLKLLDKVAYIARYRHLSLSTERTYAQWIKRYVLFHNKQHPIQLNEQHIKSYLAYLVNKNGVSKSTHKQALSALIFLYKDVLNIELPHIDDLERPKITPRLPVVLSKEELNAIFSHLNPEDLFKCQLLYGTGMRLLEMYQLRIKDIDFGLNQITVRAAKGDKDRITILPQKISTLLQNQIQHAKLFLIKTEILEKMEFIFLMHLPRNILMLQHNLLGFGFFQLHMNPPILEVKSCEDTINMNKPCNEISKQQFLKQISPNQQLYTPYAIVLLHIYYKQGKTFGQCNNF